LQNEIKNKFINENLKKGRLRKMNIKKLAPWNWFKKEENEANVHAIPVKREFRNQVNSYLPGTLQTFHDEIDRMFDNMFRQFGMLTPGSFDTSGDLFLKPKLDLSAGEKDYKISIEIPGVSEKDVNIELVNDTLIIRGEKKQQTEEKNKHFYRLERSYGEFQRILSLPDDADRETINADFKNGVLNITIPRKSVSTGESKQIEINYA
jgi:HSP20 family protein